MGGTGSVWCDVIQSEEKNLAASTNPLGKGLNCLIPIEKTIELMLMFATLMLLVSSVREKK